MFTFSRQIPKEVKILHNNIQVKKGDRRKLSGIPCAALFRLYGILLNPGAFVPIRELSGLSPLAKPKNIHNSLDIYLKIRFCIYSGDKNTSL